MSGTFVIAQSGGPTAVINQTLAGAVAEALEREPGARVLGALHGIEGVAGRHFVDLGALPPARLERIAATPGAALGSTRDRPDAAYCERIVAGLREVGASAFINIGGNDTADTQRLLHEAASDGSIAFVHAPKTIDNDLMENDHTPGFISAGAFVAAAFLSVDLDFRALPGIYVGIVMGRHAGFLAASACAWRMDEESGPHLLYVPERPFERGRFADDVRAVMARHGRCIVAMSEGVVDASGRSLVESLVPPQMLERDAHGNVRLSGTDLAHAVERLLAQELPGVRARVDTFGYLPRGSIAMIDRTDAGEAYEAGRFAVEAAVFGGGSVALRYEGGETRPALVPLEKVAGLTRTLPPEFLNAGDSRLSRAGMAYLERLLPRRFDPALPFV